MRLQIQSGEELRCRQITSWPNHIQLPSVPGMDSGVALPNNRGLMRGRRNDVTGNLFDRIRLPSHPPV